MLHAIATLFVNLQIKIYLTIVRVDDASILFQTFLALQFNKLTVEFIYLYILHVEVGNIASLHIERKIKFYSNYLIILERNQINLIIFDLVLWITHRVCVF